MCEGSAGLLWQQELSSGLFLQPGSGQAAPGATSWLGHPSGLVGETQLQVCSGNVGNAMERCSCLELPGFAGTHEVLP